MADAWGRAILDCYLAGGKPGRFYDVKETEDGLVEYGDVARFFIPAENWPEHQRWACSKVVGSVVDVGAGAGRHATYLQDTGHPVLALDTSPLALEVCRRRGIDRTFLGTVEQLMQTGRKYTTALFLAANLCLVGRPERFRSFFAIVDEIVEEGGRIVADGFDPSVVGNPRLRERLLANNQSRGLMPGQRRFRVRYGEEVEEWTDYLFLSVRELDSMLSSTNWTIKERLEDSAYYAVVLMRRDSL